MTALAAALLFLCGCVDTVQLSQRAIVQAVGVDAGAQGVEVTLQVFEPFGGDASGKTGCRIVQVSGRSVSEALENATLKQGKEVFYGHNKLIVLGRGLTAQGTKETVRFFNTAPQSRPNVDMMMADARAQDILSAKLEGSMLPVLATKMMLENYRSNGNLIRARVRDLAGAMENAWVDAFLPVVRLGGSDPDNPLIEVSGTAVLKDGRLAGEISPEETRGMLWLRGGIRKTQITLLEGEEGAVSLLAREGSLRIRPRIEEGKLVFGVWLQVNSTVAEPLKNEGSEEQGARLERYARAQSALIADEIRATMERLAEEWEADPVGLANYVVKYQPDFWREHAADYRRELAAARFEISVESDIDPAGLA